MFVKGSDIESVGTGNGMRRRILARGGKLMAVEAVFEEGAEGALHDHPHEQISYVTAGRVRFAVDGESAELGPGDSVYVPSGASHGLKALEADSAVLDVFTPQREDFLK